MGSAFRGLPGLPTISLNDRAGIDVAGRGPGGIGELMGKRALGRWTLCTSLPATLGRGLLGSNRK